MDKISHAITSRVRHAKEIWWHNPWRDAAAILWLVWGWFCFWRDEFSDQSSVSNMRVVNMIPHLSLSWWLVITMAVLLIWLFEASYRKKNSDVEAINSLQLGRPRLEAELVKHLDQWWLEIGVFDSPCVCVAQIDFKETTYTGFSGAPVGAYWRSQTAGNTSKIITGSRDRIFLYGTSSKNGKFENEFRFFNDGRENRSHGRSPWDKGSGPHVDDTGILNVYVESYPPAVNGALHKRFKFSGFLFEEL